jgi:hypothetical protein
MYDIVYRVEKLKMNLKSQKNENLSRNISQIAYLITFTFTFICLYIYIDNKQSSISVFST